MEIISFLRSWVIDIVIMFIFVTALQMMLPSKSMKKYIDVIVGFLIIFVVISPFLKVLSGGISLEQNLLKYTDNIHYNYSEDENFINTHNQQMIELYEQNLEEKIKETVKIESGYEIEDINLTVIDDANELNYGDLVGVALTVNLNKEKEEKEKKSIKINKVIIKEDKKHNTSRNDSKEGLEIKNIISKHYDVPKENIEVFLNKQLEGD